MSGVTDRCLSLWKCFTNLVRTQIRVVIKSGFSTSFKFPVKTNALSCPKTIAINLSDHIVVNQLRTLEKVGYGLVLEIKFVFFRMSDECKKKTFRTELERGPAGSSCWSHMNFVKTWSRIFNRACCNCSSPVSLMYNKAWNFEQKRKSSIIHLLFNKWSHSFW